MKTGTYAALPGTPLRYVAELALLDEGITLPRYDMSDKSADISVPKSGRIIVDICRWGSLIDKRNRHYKKLAELINLLNE